MKKIILLIILSGCSSKPVVLSEKHSCQNTASQQSSHAILSIKSQISKMQACFRNYIKFEENSKQTLKICHTLSISKKGKVTYSSVNPIEGRVPNDLKMCLEQSLWVLDFQKLQLDNSLYVKFPLIYQSK